MAVLIDTTIASSIVDRGDGHPVNQKKLAESMTAVVAVFFLLVIAMIVMYRVCTGDHPRKAIGAELIG